VQSHLHLVRHALHLDWQHHDPQDELRRRDLASVAREIRELRVDLLVVSGGEPLLQQLALAGLFAMLDGMEIEIETNGTVRPSAAITELVERFTVSPKLANSRSGRASGSTPPRWRRSPQREVGVQVRRERTRRILSRSGGWWTGSSWERVRDAEGTSADRVVEACGDWPGKSWPMAGT